MRAKELPFLFSPPLEVVLLPKLTLVQHFDLIFSQNMMKKLNRYLRDLFRLSLEQTIFFSLDCVGNFQNSRRQIPQHGIKRNQDSQINRTISYQFLWFLILIPKNQKLWCHEAAVCSSSVKVWKMLWGESSRWINSCSNRMYVYMHS